MTGCLLGRWPAGCSTPGGSRCGGGGGHRRRRCLLRSRADVQARAADGVLPQHLPRAAVGRGPALHPGARAARRGRRPAGDRGDLGRPPSKSCSPPSTTGRCRRRRSARCTRCVLPDGREAVVKLQRPGIRDAHDHRPADHVPPAPDAAAAHEVRQERQPRRRRSRTCTPSHVPGAEPRRSRPTARRRFRDGIGAFGDNKFITAPEVYWDYCGPHMICMERMSGVPMDEFDTHPRAGRRRRAACCAAA